MCERERKIGEKGGKKQREREKERGERERLYGQDCQGSDGREGSRSKVPTRSQAGEALIVQRALRGLGWVLLARTRMFAGDNGEQAGA